MRWLMLLTLLPALGWAATDVSTATPVPPAPTPGQQDVLNACLADMPHRVGPFQNHGDLVCGCMFTGATAWVPAGELAGRDDKLHTLANIIRAGGLSSDLRNAALSNRMKPAEVQQLELFARVYPAVLFKNKSVVQCFNDKCSTTNGCQVEMNDVSGTAPRN
ncbi:MAG TPA: hypothetical protein VHP58_07085 [Alphaproteobacteria bacterium]|nr:hypothetical protein [Alphaproteobacteria bacterium]